MAQERIDPRGEWRADLRAARVCWVLACIHHDKKKGEPPPLSEFMPKFEPPRQVAGDDMLAHYRAMFAPPEEQGD